jgi:50S ribosomal subunit-associated GTPase HflX
MQQQEFVPCPYCSSYKANSVSDVVRHSVKKHPRRAVVAALEKMGYGNHYRREQQQEREREQKERKEVEEADAMGFFNAGMERLRNTFPRISEEEADRLFATLTWSS